MLEYILRQVSSWERRTRLGQRQRAFGGMCCARQSALSCEHPVSRFVDAPSNTEDIGSSLLATSAVEPPERSTWMIELEEQVVSLAAMVPIVLLPRRQGFRGFAHHGLWSWIHELVSVCRYIDTYFNLSDCSWVGTLRGTKDISIAASRIESSHSAGTDF